MKKKVKKVTKKAGRPRHERSNLYAVLIDGIEIDLTAREDKILTAGVELGKTKAHMMDIAREKGCFFGLDGTAFVMKGTQERIEKLLLDTMKINTEVLNIVLGAAEKYQISARLSNQSGCALEHRPK